MNPLDAKHEPCCKEWRELGINGRRAMLAPMLKVGAVRGGRECERKSLACQSGALRYVSRALRSALATYDGWLDDALALGSTN